MRIWSRQSCPKIIFEEMGFVVTLIIEIVGTLMSLIVRTLEHQSCDVNLQKGDLTVVCRSHSPMIKSVKDGEEKAEGPPPPPFLMGDLPNL